MPDSPKPALVCLAQPAWDGDYVKSTVRLIEALAAHYRVLYVDYAHGAAGLGAYRSLLLERGATYGEAFVGRYRNPADGSGA